MTDSKSAIGQKRTPLARAFCDLKLHTGKPAFLYVTSEQTIAYILDMDSLQPCWNGALLATGISPMANRW